MTPRLQRLQWVVWGTLGLTVAAILVAFLVLPGSHRVEDPASGLTLISSKGPPAKLPVLFDVGEFALTNQSGKLVSRSQMEGHVWLADIIFTRCAGPCPEMTRKMGEIDKAVPTNLPVMFVTLTTDPQHDTPPVLETYRRRFGPPSERWHFMTGSKEDLMRLAIEGLKLTSLEKEQSKRESPEDLFVHSTLFVLVDQQGKARAVFESDAQDVRDQVIGAINQLLR